MVPFRDRYVCQALHFSEAFCAKRGSPLGEAPPPLRYCVITNAICTTEIRMDIPVNTVLMISINSLRIPLPLKAGLLSWARDAGWYQHVFEAPGRPQPASSPVMLAPPGVSAADRSRGHTLSSVARQDFKLARNCDDSALNSRPARPARPLCAFAPSRGPDPCFSPSRHEKRAKVARP
jgi:hypothetical protein